jgi:hypothetical protein
MMKTIWKYTFEIVDVFEIEMPVGAKVLTVQLQGGQPCMWAEVNPLAPTERVQFRVIGTGHSFTPTKYVGTIQTGMFVWHVYEGIDP